MNIIFKETKDLDYEQVVDIFYSVKFLRYPEKRKIYKETIEKAFHNSQYVASAWDNNRLIGFLRVLTDGSIFAAIWNLIVAPGYQKKGIGQSLVKKCLDKYPSLCFFIIADKETSEFYQKLGFKLPKQGVYLYKGKEVCVIYN